MILVSQPPTSRHARSGFTLIELLVVIGIIGALAGFLFPIHGALRYKAWSSKSRDVSLQVAQAWLFYFQEHRQFPVSTLATLPDAAQEGGDYKFPMSPEASKLLATYFEQTDIQKKVGILSAWGDRKARVAVGTAGSLDALDADAFAGHRIWVKLDTDYDGEIEWQGDTFKKSAIAWSPGETPERPVIRAW